MHATYRYVGEADATGRTTSASRASAPPRPRPPVNVDKNGIPAPALWIALAAPEMMPGNGFTTEAMGVEAAAIGAANPAPMPEPIPPARPAPIPAPKPPFKTAAFKLAAFKSLAGTATATGKMIGDFFKFFKIFTPAASLAIFNALAAFRPAILNAIAFLTLRNGAVMILSAAIFFALS